MSRKACILALAIFIASSVNNHAAAQFWKHWFKKEQPRHKYVPHKPSTAGTQAKNTAKPIAKKHEIDFPETTKKERYRVDVLTQLYLDDLVKNDQLSFKDKLPEKAATGVDFYEGIKLAADTLNELGLKVDVYVHDITDITESTASLMSSGKLDSTDLIIGAVPSNQIDELARFAKRRKINFVSALSPSDGGVKDNPYFTLIQPTLKSHCEAITKAISKKYAHDNVTLLYRTNVAIDENAYKGVIPDTADTKMQTILCNVLPDKQKLTGLFDANRVNVVIISVFDNTYAEALLKLLYQQFPDYKFEVYGMPSWKTMGSLHKADAYPNIGVTITMPFYFDVSKPAAQSFEAAYKREFGSRPDEWGYRGYETLYWYANLLDKYGNIYNDNNTDDSSAPFTKFEVKPRWDKQDDLLYTENRHLYFMRYQSGSYIIQQ